MSWVRLDDGFTDHPKVLEAGEDAAWLFVAGLIYCNRNPRNNGFIPSGQVPRLTVKRNAMELARRLVTCGEPTGKVGLWEEVTGGFVVHDYHEFQPEQGANTDENRAAIKSAAGRKGGLSTQQRAPGVAKNLRQYRKNSPEAPPKQATEADHRSNGLFASEATPKQATEAGSEAPAEAAPKQELPKHTEAHRSPVPDPEKLLSRAHPAHAHDPVAPGRGTFDLDQLWSTKYRRAVGDTTTAMQLVAMLRETAAIRGERVEAFAPRFLEAFSAMLTDWHGRGKHNGQPTVAHAVKHFSAALGFLDGEGQQQSTGPDLPTVAQLRAQAKAAAGGGHS